MTGPATAAADDALVQQHYAWVRAAAMRQVRDPHVADDVAQAVFIVLMQKKLEFNSDAALSAWLFQTMRYAAAHAMRSQRRRARHEARAAQAKQARARRCRIHSRRHRTKGGSRSRRCWMNRSPGCGRTIG